MFPSIKAQETQLPIGITNNSGDTSIRENIFVRFSLIIEPKVLFNVTEFYDEKYEQLRLAIIKSATHALCDVGIFVIVRKPGIFEINNICTSNEKSQFMISVQEIETERDKAILFLESNSAILNVTENVLLSNPEIKWLKIDLRFEVLKHGKDDMVSVQQIELNAQLAIEQSITDEIFEAGLKNESKTIRGVSNIGMEESTFSAYASLFLVSNAKNPIFGPTRISGLVLLVSISLITSLLYRTAKDRMLKEDTVKCTSFNGMGHLGTEEGVHAILEVSQRQTFPLPRRELSMYHPNANDTVIL